MTRSVALLFLSLVAFSVSSLSELLACDRCGLPSSCYYSGQQHVHGLQAGSDGEVHHDDLAAFRTFQNGWTNTSTGSSGLGNPATLTWSIVPDDTALPTGLGEPVSNSGLIEFLDGVHHGGSSPGGTDLTQRAWWQLFNSAFERWDALSGLNFSYEAEDDGVRLGAFQGVNRVRGDHRIGGHSIDGQTSPTFLAYNFFPNNSDMVIDTDEIDRWSTAGDNFRLFRNMLMHEIGHGVGLNHVEPTTQTKLMEPKISTLYDGPQYDDILGVQRLYGDVNEEGAGNDTFSTATTLGSLLVDTWLAVGTDAADELVESDETDFVSIDDNSDVDYFRFTVPESQAVSVLLHPMGPDYFEGSAANNTEPFLGSQRSDLTLQLFDTDGTSLLAASDQFGLGLTETITNFQLSSAGDYFVRVGGKQDDAQFFRLDVVAVPEPSTLLLASLAILTATARRR